MEHIPLNVMYPPADTMNPAKMNAQIARLRPNVLTEPSALVDENRTK